MTVPPTNEHRIVNNKQKCFKVGSKWLYLNKCILAQMNPMLHPRE